MQAQLVLLSSRVCEIDGFNPALWTRKPNFYCYFSAEALIKVDSARNISCVLILENNRENYLEAQNCLMASAVEGCFRQLRAGVLNHRSIGCSLAPISVQPKVQPQNCHCSNFHNHWNRLYTLSSGHMHLQRYRRGVQYIRHKLCITGTNRNLRHSNDVADLSRSSIYDHCCFQHVDTHQVEQYGRIFE